MNPVINPDLAVFLYILPGLLAAVGCAISYYRLWRNNKQKANK